MGEGSAPEGLIGSCLVTVVNIWEKKSSQWTGQQTLGGEGWELGRSSGLGLADSRGEESDGTN